MRTIIAHSLTVAATGVLLAGCGEDTTAREGGTASAEGSTTYPLTVENCGMDVTVEQSPERVVSTDQEMTEILIHLGAADRIVGMGAETYPVSEEIAEEFGKIPVLGAKSESIPHEELLEAQPDLLFSAYAWHLVADKTGERQELHDLGVPTYLNEFDCVHDEKVEDVSFEMLFEEYREIGEVLDVPAAAEDLVAEQQAVLDDGLAAAEDVEGAPSMVWFYSTYEGTPYVAGPGGLPQHVTELVGGTNAFDDASTKWPEVSWDEIAARNPDVIVLADLTRGLPGDTAEEKIELLKEDPVTSKLDAVVNERFIVVPASYMEASYGSVYAVPAVAEGLVELQ